MEFDLIIFDIDGTLINSSKGIINSVKYAVKKLSLKPTNSFEYKWFLGGSPNKMYKEFFGCTSQEAINATSLHRKYGREHGYLESELYPGIIDLLNILKKHNVRMAVATLKGQKIADKILKHHKIYDYFIDVVGMDTNETFTKPQIIKMILDRHSSKNPVMVGDTIYDLEGARCNLIKFIGVSYGYGFTKNESNLCCLCHDTSQLLCALTNGLLNCN